jgi:hypothetical protein
MARFECGNLWQSVATKVANFLRSSEFLDAATDALAGIMKDSAVQ